MSCPNPTIIIPAIKKPKSGKNYDNATLCQSITIEEATRLVSEVTKLIPKGVSISYAIHLSPGLGTTIHAIVKSGIVEGVYTFAIGNTRTFLEENLKAWNMTDQVDVSDNFEQKVFESLLAESIVIIDVMNPIALENLFVTLSSIKKAAFVVIRSTYTLDTDSYGYESKTVKDPTGTFHYFMKYDQRDEKKHAEWLNLLKEYLKKLLSKFIEKKNVPKYLTDEYMTIWETAFTTEAVNPELNSEELELLGDGMLDYCVLRYIYRRIKKLNKGQANQLKSVLVRKNYLGRLATRLKMIDHVITFKVTKHVKEDVFESFIGALVDISDKITEGLSYVNCYNFIVFVYNDEEMGDASTLPIAPGITLVPQFFIRIGLGSVQNPAVKDSSEKVQGDFGESQWTESTVYVEDWASKVLVGLGITLPKDKVLGSARDIDAKESRKYAYENAYNKLIEIGMTPQWIDKTSQTVMFNKPEIKPFYKPALAKAKASGYVDIAFISSGAQTTYSSKVITLAGILSNGKKEFLSIGEGPDRDTAMLNAIKNYVSSTC